MPQEKRTEKTPSYEEGTKPTSTVTDSTTIEDISGVSPTSLETTAYMTKALTRIKETVPPSDVIHSTTEGEIPAVSPTTKFTPPVFIPSPSDEKELTTQVTPTTFQVKTEDVFEIGSGTTETPSSSVLYSTGPTSKQKPIVIVSEVPTLTPEVFPSTSSTTIPETTIEYETGTSTLEVTGTTTFSAEGITSGASQSSAEATTLHETSGPALSTIVPETSKTVNVSEKVSVIPEITPEVLYTTQLLTSIPGLSSSLPPIDVKETEPISFISDSTTVEEISGVPTTTHKSTTVLITSVPEDEEVTSGMIHSTFQIITEGTKTETGSGTTEETPSTMWSSTRTTLTQSPIPVVSGVSTLTTKGVIPYTAPVTIQEPTIGYTMSHSPEITSSLSPTTLEMLTDEATTKTIFEHTRFTTDSTTREEISKSKIPPGQLEKAEPTTYATVSLTEEEISGVSPTTAEIRQVFTTSASIDKKTTIPPRFIIHSTTEEEISGVSPTIQETTSAPDIMEVTSGATPPVFHIITNEVTHFPQEKITEKSPSYLEQTESTSTMTDSATKEDISGVSPTSQVTTKYMTKAPIDIKETVPPSFIIDSTTEGEISGVSTTTEETPTVLITSVLPEEVEVTSGVSLSTLQTTEGATTEASSGTTKETPSIMLYSTRTTLQDSPISIVSRVSTLATEEESPVTVPVTTQKSTTEYKTSKSHQVTSNMFPATLESDTYESISTTIFEPTKFISVSTTEEEISGVSPIGQETTKEYFITTPDDKISDLTSLHI